MHSKHNRWSMNYDKCIKCGTTKEGWYMAKGMCKACYAKDYYWTKPGERMKNKARAISWQTRNKNHVLNYYKDRKYEVLFHYSGGIPKCTCCGETTYDFLTMDHIDGGGHQHRKKVGRGRFFYTWIRLNNFPTGFQVLCMNCNFAKGMLGICPHQKDASKVT